MLLLLSSSLLVTAASLVPQPTKYVKVINLLDRHLSYSSAWDLQLDLMQHHMALQDMTPQGMTPQDETALLRGLAAGDIGGVCVGSVVLCQHSPTYTLGSATTEGSGPFSKTLSDGSMLEYETFTVERAGQATYHGPGQLVVYPILDLGHFSKDINLYLRGLEEVVISTLADFHIPAQRIEGLTGVWTVLPDGADGKIAALGIKLRRWVTMHGLSLNVCPDMRYFDNIVPCGIADKGVTSMQAFNAAFKEARKMASVSQSEKMKEIEESEIPLLSTMVKEMEPAWGDAMMGEVSTQLLKSLSSQFSVRCHPLSEAEADTYIADITSTYGPCRPNYVSTATDVTAVTAVSAVSAVGATVSQTEPNTVTREAIPAVRVAR